MRLLFTACGPGEHFQPRLMVPLQSRRAEAYKVCANRQPGREWGGREREGKIYYFLGTRTHPGVQPEVLHPGKTRSLMGSLIPLNTSHVVSQGARGSVTYPSISTPCISSGWFELGIRPGEEPLQLKPSPHQHPCPAEQLRC